MYIEILCTYYRGADNEWVLVNKEYSNFSLLKEVQIAFNKYNLFMKRMGYEATIKGNKATFISENEKVVSKYYKCKPVILS